MHFIIQADAAHEEDNLSILEENLQDGWLPTKEVAEFLISYGDQVNCLRVIHKAGCSLTSEMVLTAVTYGHLKCLNYLVKAGCLVDDSAVHLAAMVGQLECLKYLVEICRPEKVCESAAAMGELECLEWLYKDGFKLHDTAACAATFGQLRCLLFVLERSKGEVEIDIEKMIENGHLDCTKVIHINGGLSNNNIDLAIIYNQMEIFDYLKSEGYKWNKHLFNHDGSRSWLAMKLAKDCAAIRRTKEKELMST